MSDRGRLRGAVAMAVAILVALGPAISAPGRWIVGADGVDAWGTQWFFWYAGEVLRGAQHADHTNLLFYPWGKDVLLHTGGNLLDAWLAAPLRAIAGPVAGFDLWIALLLAGNAFAGTRLAAAIGVSPGERWLAGVAMVLNPYVLMEIQLGRPTQAFLLFPGLCAAALWRLGRGEGRVGTAVLAGVTMAATGWTYWYHGLVLGILAISLGIWRIAVGPGRGRVLGMYTLAATVCLAILAPTVWPMLGALRSGEVPGLLALDGTGPLAPLALRTVQGDSEGLWVLALLRGGSGSLIDEGGLRYVPGIPVLLAVSLPAFFLAIRRMDRRDAGAIAVWVGVALAIASGPLLVYGGSFVRNVPWLWAMTHVDLLRRWWWPGRAVFAAQLAFAALLPLAVRGRWWLAAAWVVGAVWQLHASDLFPLGRWDASTGKALACLASAPAGAVIDVPWAKDQKNLWLQTAHHKPLLSGMLVKKAEFGAEPVLALRDGNTLLRNLIAIGDHAWTIDLDFPDEDRARLLELGYRYVLARADAFQRPDTARDGTVRWVSEWSRPRRLIEKMLGTPPVIEDGQAALWTLDGSAVDCP